MSFVCHNNISEKELEFWTNLAIEYWVGAEKSIRELKCPICPLIVQIQFERIMEVLSTPLVELTPDKRKAFEHNMSVFEVHYRPWIDKLRKEEREYLRELRRDPEWTYDEAGEERVFERLWDSGGMDSLLLHGWVVVKRKLRLFDFDAQMRLL